MKTQFSQDISVKSEILDHGFALSHKPERVVSLTSGATEAIFRIGCGNQVAGVSSYCSRYIDESRPVVGDYLKVDEDLLKHIEPDLIIVTSGVQAHLGRKLAQRGYPVYCLPLPNSFFGVLENIVTAAALLGEVGAGRLLAAEMDERACSLRRSRTTPAPRVYLELWFGKHARTIGGRSFIHDIIDFGGGDSIYSDSSEAFLDLDLPMVAKLRPDVIVGFSEPEYPVDFDALIGERGWSEFCPAVVRSDVTRGRNLIHDGPSMIDSAEWMRQKLSDVKRK